MMPKISKLERLRTQRKHLGILPSHIEIEGNLDSFAYLDQVHELCGWLDAKLPYIDINFALATKVSGPYLRVVNLSFLEGLYSGYSKLHFKETALRIKMIATVFPEILPGSPYKFHFDEITAIIGV